MTKRKTKTVHKIIRRTTAHFNICYWLHSLYTTFISNSSK